MYRQYSDGARRYCRLDQLRVQAISVVDIDKGWPRTAMQHRFDRGEGGMRWHNDFITRPQPHRQMQQINARRPRRTQHRMLAPGMLGEFPLEFLALRSQDKTPRIQHVEHGLAYFAIDERLG